MSDTNTVAKFLIVLFVLEIIGILITYLINVNTGFPALTQFNNFSSNIQNRIKITQNSFNATILTPLNITNPSCTFLWVFSCGSNPVANAILSLGNAGIYIVNVIWKVFTLVINLFVLVFTLIALLIDLFFYVIPSLLISVGILGYLFGLGYAFIIIFLSYYFVKELFEILRG